MFDQMEQCPPSYIFEHDERSAGMTAYVKHGDDPRMLQPGCRPRFLGELQQVVFAPKPVRPRDLQGNQTIQFLIVCQENVGEATSSKATANGVPANPFGQRPITRSRSRLSATSGFRQFVFVSIRFVVSHDIHMPARKRRFDYTSLQKWFWNQLPRARRSSS